MRYMCSGLGHLNAWRDKRKKKSIENSAHKLWAVNRTGHTSRQGDRQKNMRKKTTEIYPICLSVELSHFVVHNPAQVLKKVKAILWCVMRLTSNATFRLRIFLNCWNMVPFTLYLFPSFFSGSFLFPQSIYYILFSKLGRPSELFTLRLFIDCIYTHGAR